MRGARKRLRVAYVYRRFGGAGSIPSFYTRNAEQLSYDEDVTAVCARRGRGPTQAPLRFMDVDPATVGTGRYRYAAECLSFALAASARLRRHRGSFDVVHVEGFAALSADLVSVHAVRPAELEHYFSAVEPRAFIRRRLSPYVGRPQTAVVMGIERCLFRPGHQPYCITPTRAIKADLERVYGLPEHLVSVVPYGIDLERFGADPAVGRRVRDELGVPYDRMVYLFVGDNFERKGLARTIDALAGCANGEELWVVGGSPSLVDRYRRHAVRAGVGSRVRFLGRRPGSEVPNWFAAADVFVLLSQQDSWGHTVIEALASGVPVMISEHVGASEILRDGDTGFVLPGRGEVQQAAAVMSGPLRDRETRRAIVERARLLAPAYDRAAIYPLFREAHLLAYEARQARSL